MSFTLNSKRLKQDNLNLEENIFCWKQIINMHIQDGLTSLLLISTICIVWLFKTQIGLKPELLLDYFQLKSPTAAYDWVPLPVGGGNCRQM